MAEVDAGNPVAIVYPDQENRDGGSEALGTLLIPNTAAIIRGGAHNKAAQQLTDYLLSPAVEAQLAAGPSAQFPLNPEVDVRSRARPPDDLRVMQVDFRAAAARWDEVAAFLRAQFAAAE